jgi:hypothetical protein
LHAAKERAIAAKDTAKAAEAHVKPAEERAIAAKETTKAAEAQVKAAEERSIAAKESLQHAKESPLSANKSPDGIPGTLAELQRLSLP